MSGETQVAKTQAFTFLLKKFHINQLGRQESEVWHNLIMALLPKADTLRAESDYHQTSEAITLLQEELCHWFFDFLKIFQDEIREESSPLHYQDPWFLFNYRSWATYKEDGAIKESEFERNFRKKLAAHLKEKNAYYPYKKSDYNGVGNLDVGGISLAETTLAEILTLLKYADGKINSIQFSVSYTDFLDGSSNLNKIFEFIKEHRITTVLFLSRHYPENPYRGTDDSDNFHAEYDKRIKEEGELNRQLQNAACINRRWVNKQTLLGLPIYVEEGVEKQKTKETGLAVSQEEESQALNALETQFEYQYQQQATQEAQSENSFSEENDDDFFLKTLTKEEFITSFFRGGERVANFVLGLGTDQDCLRQYTFQRITIDAAAQIKKYGVYYDGFNINKLPPGFYSRRIRNENILCYHPGYFDEKNPPTPLTLEPYHRDDDARFYGDYRQFKSSKNYDALFDKAFSCCRVVAPITTLMRNPLEILPTNSYLLTGQVMSALRHLMKDEDPEQATAEFLDQYDDLMSSDLIEFNGCRNLRIICSFVRIFYEYDVVGVKVFIEKLYTLKKTHPERFSHFCKLALHLDSFSCFSTYNHFITPEGRSALNALIEMTDEQWSLWNYLSFGNSDRDFLISMRAYQYFLSKLEGMKLVWSQFPKTITTDHVLCEHWWGSGFFGSERKKEFFQGCNNKLWLERALFILENVRPGDRQAQFEQLIHLDLNTMDGAYFAIVYNGFNFLHPKMKLSYSGGNKSIAKGASIPYVTTLTTLNSIPADWSLEDIQALFYRYVGSHPRKEAFSQYEKIIEEVEKCLILYQLDPVLHLTFSKLIYRFIACCTVGNYFDPNEIGYLLKKYVENPNSLKEILNQFYASFFPSHLETFHPSLTESLAIIVLIEHAQVNPTEVLNFVKEKIALYGTLFLDVMNDLYKKNDPKLHSLRSICEEVEAVLSQQKKPQESTFNLEQEKANLFSELTLKFPDVKESISQFDTLFGKYSSELVPTLKIILNEDRYEVIEKLLLIIRLNAPIDFNDENKAKIYLSLLPEVIHSFLTVRSSSFSLLNLILGKLTQDNKQSLLQFYEVLLSNHGLSESEKNITVRIAFNLISIDTRLVAFISELKNKLSQQPEYFNKIVEDIVYMTQKNHNLTFSNVAEYWSSLERLNLILPPHYENKLLKYLKTYKVEMLQTLKLLDRIKEDAQMLKLILLGGIQHQLELNVLEQIVSTLQQNPSIVTAIASYYNKKPYPSLKNIKPDFNLDQWVRVEIMKEEDIARKSSDPRFVVRVASHIENVLIDNMPQQAKKQLHVFDAWPANMLLPVYITREIAGSLEVAPTGQEKPLSSLTENEKIALIMHYNRALLEGTRDDLIDMFFYIELLSAEIPLSLCQGQPKSAKDFSPEEIVKQIQYFKELLQKNPSDNQRLTIQLECIALMREVMLRTTGLYPNSTQILAVLVSITHPGNLTLEVNTGEGKSLIGALQAGLLCLEGAVDICSANTELAQRDAKRFKSFYQALGMSSHFISAHSSLRKYKNSGVNYSDMQNLSIFRSRADVMTFLGYEKENEKPNRRSLMIDEIDFSLFDNKTQMVFSANLATNENAHPVWIYYLLNDFIQSGKFKKQHRFREENIDNARDYLIKHSEPRRYKYINHLSRRKLGIWLDSAFTASLLEEDRAYRIIKIRQEDGDILYRAHALIEHRTMGRQVKLSRGVQQFLHARLNTQPEFKSLAPFPIEPELLAVNAQTCKTFMDSYKGTGRIVGLTGTSGSSKEHREALKKSAMQFYRIPPHKPNLRVDEDVIFVDTLEKQIAQIKETLLKQKTLTQPILVFCKDIPSLKAIKDKIEKDNDFQGIHLQFYANDNLPEENAPQSEQEIIVQAGKPHVTTFSTPLFSRGVDIDTEQESLLVILTFVASERVTRQMLGRSGRFGKPGNTKTIINKEDLNYPRLKPTTALTQVRTAVEKENKRLRKIRTAFGDIRDYIETCFDTILHALASANSSSISKPSSSNEIKTEDEKSITKISRDILQAKQTMIDILDQEWKQMNLKSDLILDKKIHSFAKMACDSYNDWLRNCKDLIQVFLSPQALERVTQEISFQQLLNIKFSNYVLRNAQEAPFSLSATLPSVTQSSQTLKAQFSLDEDTRATAKQKRCLTTFLNTCNLKMNQHFDLNNLIRFLEEAYKNTFLKSEGVGRLERKELSDSIHSIACNTEFDVEARKIVDAARFNMLNEFNSHNLLDYSNRFFVAEDRRALIKEMQLAKETSYLESVKNYLIRLGEKRKSALETDREKDRTSFIPRHIFRTGGRFYKVLDQLRQHALLLCTPKERDQLIFLEMTDLKTLVANLKYRLQDSVESDNTLLGLIQKIDSTNLASSMSSGEIENTISLLMNQMNELNNHFPQKNTVLNYYHSMLQHRYQQFIEFLKSGSGIICLSSFQLKQAIYNVVSRPLPPEPAAFRFFSQKSNVNNTLEKRKAAVSEVIKQTVTIPTRILDYQETKEGISFILEESNLATKMMIPRQSGEWQWPIQERDCELYAGRNAQPVHM